MSRTTDTQSVNLGMNTEMTHRAFGKHAEEALRAVAGEAVRLEQMLSCFIPGSEISRINRSAGIQCEKLSLDTYELLSLAVHFSSFCQGLFDVTIGPLVALWDYKNSYEIPDEAKIRRVLALVNYADLMLDPYEKTAGLQKVGQSINLGGIGKGFASDKLLEVFKKFDVTSACTNIGGNVAVLGTKPDGSPWRVGIRHPRQEGRLIGAVSVADKGVVTSGDYQRYFWDRNGKRRHHILNPHTGYPAESGLISVTIVADSATTADALSTLFFVAGIEKGRKLLANFPGAEVILVDSELQVYVSQGLKDCFQADKGIRTNILNS
ncbi:thiamine biosynthesis lipoprotein [Fontibacillus panacisegetis]|uniref:FAD:protein FMN transferase n=1 Tax=Fontibacillus panacisegetis TaxID=670482 RepID=A0A1G7RK18_9BACL|nr:FAD:protein FMN transferase [Fontibacillus panacisegetis]SDG11014.1 thiamine biosynthesis lipoprotein [Fontibacillus panacisegetis]